MTAPGAGSVPAGPGVAAAGAPGFGATRVNSSAPVAPPGAHGASGVQSVPGVPGVPGVQNAPAPAAPVPAGPSAAGAPAPVKTGRGGKAGKAEKKGAGTGSPPREPAPAPPRRSKGQRRPPRLASLQLKRVDPWTVLKISLIVSIVMFFVWMIAVGVLYMSLGSLDVWTKLNDTWHTLTSADSDGNVSDLVTAGGVFTVTAVIGAINIVLFTALATIAAFIYNAAAGMSGGVEITLGERD